MLPKLQFYFTNWVDGMKINRQHFIDSENALVDQLRDGVASSLNAFNYGLQQPLPGEKSALDCTASFNQSRKFRIVVTHCRAVTAGGCRIEIIPGIHPELTSDNDIFPDSEGTGGANAVRNYFAVISVDPYNRQPYGAAAAEEYPPRNKYSISACKLSLVAEEDIHTGSLGAFHLPVAKFNFRNDELTRDAAYIPPCAVAGAHPGARQIHAAIAAYFNEIREFSTVIVRKVVEGGQNTALAQNVRNLCEQGIRHISSEAFFFMTMYSRQSPVFMANTVVQLAGIINVSISLLPAKEKEDMLQYFSYWNEISPGRFEELLAGTTNANYDHEDIYGFFQPLLAVLKVWSELLDKLKDLKLIGQRKEGFDFGGRTMDTTKDKGKGKFSIFD